MNHDFFHLSETWTFALQMSSHLGRKRHSVTRCSLHYCQGLLFRRQAAASALTVVSLHLLLSRGWQAFIISLLHRHLHLHSRQLLHPA